MARTMAAEDKVVYRAVITGIKKDGQPYREVIGPYSKPGTAASAAAAKVNPRRRFDGTAGYTIESTVLVWGRYSG